MARAFLLAVLAVAGYAVAQTESDVVADGRQLARAVAHKLQERVGADLCQHPVAWVGCVDISGSTAGAWQTCVKAAIGDLAKYVMVAGDSLTILPFDRDVDPLQPGESSAQRFPRQFEIQGNDRSDLGQAIERLLVVRPGVKGTSWAAAMSEALRRVQHGGTDRLAVCLLFADRASDDARDSDSESARYQSKFEKIAGVAAPQDRGLAWGDRRLPFSRDWFVLQTGRTGAAASRVELFLAVSTAEPPAALTTPPRQIPPERAQPVASTPSERVVSPTGQRFMGSLLILVGAVLAGWAYWAGLQLRFRWGEDCRPIEDRHVHAPIRVADQTGVLPTADGTLELGARLAPGLSETDQRMLKAAQPVGGLTKRGARLMLEPVGRYRFAGSEEWRKDPLEVVLDEIYQWQLSWPDGDRDRSPATAAVEFSAARLWRGWWQACAGGVVMLLVGLLVLGTARPRLVSDDLAVSAAPMTEWMCDP